MSNAPDPSDSVAGAAGRQRSPMDEILDLMVLERTEGRVVPSAPPRAAFANLHGALHGGWIATLLDAAAGAAVDSVLKPGEGYVTLALSVSYLRAISPGRSPVQATGRILRRGRRVVTSEATVINHESEVCAVATANCLVIRQE